MRRLALLISSLQILSHIASTQDMPPRSTSDPSQVQQVDPGNGMISGSVVDATTHQPLKKAHVMLNGTISLSAGTDAGGSFTFRGLPPGAYFLIASREGYFAGPDRGTAAQVDLSANEEKTGVAVSLYPGASLSGRVVDDDDAPVQNCQILALRLDRNTGRFNMTAAASTDEEGRYELSGLMQGRYIVESQCRRTFPAPHGFLPRNDPATPREGFSRAFQGGGQADPSKGGFSLKSGAQLTGIDFHVQRVPLYTVRATIGIADVPKNNIMVRLTDSNPELRGAFAIALREDPATGEYRSTAVPAGSYALVAGAFFARTGYSAQQKIEVGKGLLPPVSLYLTPGVIVTGTVETDDPNLQLQEASISLTSLEPDFWGSFPFAQLLPDGSFKLPNVSPGHWKLNPVGSYYLKSVFLGSREISPEDFEIVAGAASDLRIALGSKKSKLEVDLTSPPSDAAHLAAVLVPENPSLAIVDPSLLMTHPDSHGRLVFDSAPPGKFRLYVLNTAAAPDLLQSGALKALESRASEVELQEGGDQKVSASLIPAEDLQKAEDEN